MNDVEKNLKSISNITCLTPNNEIPDISSLQHVEKNILQEILHKNGAILLRGFKIDNEENFKKVASAFIEDLMSENGEHNPVKNIDGIYTPVNYSPKEKLLWHNENSFNYSWPLIIIFGALKPAQTGGETPIVDGRRMLAALDPQIVEEFKQKGVMYVRTHGFGLGLSWQQTYRTNNKIELETYFKKYNIQADWREADQLITKQVRPAVVAHPVKGELSWFTQAQHWHPYCLGEEIRSSLLEIFSEDTLPRNCYFGDGSIIPDNIMQHILDTYQKLEQSFVWQKGDVMLLDNVLFSHARNAYIGERNLLVAMGKEACFLDKIGQNSILMA